MKRSFQKGFGLAGTLVVALLVFMLALVVSGASLFHLSLSTRTNQEAIAQDLAESAVAKIIERVLEQEKRTGQLDYGADSKATERVAQVEAGEGSFGLATFDPDYSGVSGLTINASVNNLQSDSSIEAGNGTVIPKESLYIVGHGFCGSVTRRVEAIVYLPRFPYSVACQGTFSGTDVLIAGVSEETQVLPGVAVADEDLQVGHIVSNSERGDTAVELFGSSRVKGNIRSVSGARLSPDTRVDGELLLHSSPVEIPRIDLERYRPTGENVFRGLLPVERELELGRTAYFQSLDAPLTILDGLTLDGGFLFVDGDLHVRGGVQGKGAVIVKGNLTIGDVGAVSSDNVAAFLASGDVTIQGSGSKPEDSLIEGLVYAGGKATLRNLTLVGVLLSAGREESTLENSTVLQREQNGLIEIVGIDTSTHEDPTTWEHIDFGFSQQQPPPGVLFYRVSNSSGIDQGAINNDLDRDFNELESREVEEAEEDLSKLRGPEKEGGDHGGATGGAPTPWYGFLVVAPVDHSQIRTVSTAAPFDRTDVVESKTLLRIDLADFVSPLERMRVRWWRNI